MIIYVYLDKLHLFKAIGHHTPPVLRLKLVNVLLHFSCSLVLFLFLRSPRTLGKLGSKAQEELALFSSLLFASHPVHVEPVVNT